MFLCQVDHKMNKQNHKQKWDRVYSTLRDRTNNKRKKPVLERKEFQIFWMKLTWELDWKDWKVFMSPDPCCWCLNRVVIRKVSGSAWWTMASLTKTIEDETKLCVCVYPAVSRLSCRRWKLENCDYEMKKQKAWNKSQNVRQSRNFFRIDSKYGLASIGYQELEESPMKSEELCRQEICEDQTFM